MRSRTDITRLHPRLAAPLAAAVAAGLVAATVGSAETPGQQAKAKQAQAAGVMRQIDAIDAQVGHAAEAYDGARYRLSQLQGRLVESRRRLGIAQSSYRTAVDRVSQRLVTLYTTGEPAPIDVIAGAKSLSDLLDRVDAAKAIADQDARLATQTRSARHRFLTEEHHLRALVRDQGRAVAAAAANKRAIERDLAQRKQLLAGIQGEIAVLQRQEAARQARLAAEARARLEARLRAEAAARAEAQRRAEAERRAAAARLAAQQAAARTAARAHSTQPPAAAAAPTTGPSGTAAVTAAPSATGAPAASTTTTTPATTSATAPATAPATADPGTDATAGGPQASTATAPVALPPSRPEAASIALRYLGTPYLWGAMDPAVGFDCSGLVAYVYAQLGITLPHYAAAQYGYGVAVPLAQLEPGDLVFFDGLDHVGIYIGGGQFVHAPHTGDVVKISSLAGGYLAKFVGARRV